MENVEFITTEDSIQEVEMWSRFARLATQPAEEARKKDVFERAAYWRLLSLRTQEVMDACMKSAFEEHGQPVAFL